MVLDWMLLFFKQLTTNQYMDQQELYQQNWCSIVGGVLDWMLFFSKHWQLVSTWMMDRIILKITQSRSGIPLWEVFLIGCYSFSNVQQPVSTWMMDSIIPKTTQIRSGIPLWEVLMDVILFQTSNNYTVHEYHVRISCCVIVVLCCCVVVLLCCCVVVSVLLCCCVVVMYFSPRCIKMECGNSEKQAL